MITTTIPTFTFAITTMGNMAFLDRCIRSITTCYGYTPDRFAIDVFNDNPERPLDSGEGNVRFFNGAQNVGQGAARNYLIDACRTDYIMFLDDDDFLATTYALHLLLSKIPNDDSDFIQFASTYLSPVGVQPVDCPSDLSDVTIHNTFFKRVTLQERGARFRLSRVFEDIAFMSEWYIKCPQGRLSIDEPFVCMVRGLGTYSSVYTYEPGFPAVIRELCCLLDNECAGNTGYHKNNLYYLLYEYSLHLRNDKAQLERYLAEVRESFNPAYLKMLLFERTEHFGFSDLVLSKTAVFNKLFGINTLLCSYKWFADLL